MSFSMTHDTCSPPCLTSNDASLQAQLRSLHNESTKLLSVLPVLVDAFLLPQQKHRESPATASSQPLGAVHALLSEPGALQAEAKRLDSSAKVILGNLPAAGQLENIPASEKTTLRRIGNDLQATSISLWNRIAGWTRSIAMTATTALIDETNTGSRCSQRVDGAATSPPFLSHPSLGHLRVFAVTLRTVALTLRDGANVNPKHVNDLALMCVRTARHFDEAEEYSTVDAHLEIAACWISKLRLSDSNNEVAESSAAATRQLIRLTTIQTLAKRRDYAHLTAFVDDSLTALRSSGAAAHEFILAIAREAATVEHQFERQEEARWTKKDDQGEAAFGDSAAMNTNSSQVASVSVNDVKHAIQWLRGALELGQSELANLRDSGARFAEADICVLLSKLLLHDEQPAEALTAARQADSLLNSSSRTALVQVCYAAVAVGDEAVDILVNSMSSLVKHQDFSPSRVLHVCERVWTKGYETEALQTLSLLHHRVASRASDGTDGCKLVLTRVRYHLCRRLCAIPLKSDRLPQAVSIYEALHADGCCGSAESNTEVMLEYQRSLLIIAWSVGQELAGQSRLHDAATWLRLAVRFAHAGDPLEMARLFRTLCQVHYELGNLEAARAAANDAAQCDPRSTHTHLLLFKLDVDRDAREEAACHMQRLVVGEPRTHVVSACAVAAQHALSRGYVDLCFDAFEWMLQEHNNYVQEEALRTSSSFDGRAWTDRVGITTQEALILLHSLTKLILRSDAIKPAAIDLKVCWIVERAAELLPPHGAQQLADDESNDKQACDRLWWAATVGDAGIQAEEAERFSNASKLFQLGASLLSKHVESDSAQSSEPDAARLYEDLVVRYAASTLAQYQHTTLPRDAATCLRTAVTPLLASAMHGERHYGILGVAAITSMVALGTDDEAVTACVNFLVNRGTADDDDDEITRDEPSCRTLSFIDFEFLIWTVHEYQYANNDATDDATSQPIVPRKENMRGSNNVQKYHKTLRVLLSGAQKSALRTHHDGSSVSQRVITLLRLYRVWFEQAHTRDEQLACLDCLISNLAADPAIAAAARSTVDFHSVLSPGNNTEVQPRSRGIPSGMVVVEEWLWFAVEAWNSAVYYHSIRCDERAMEWFELCRKVTQFARNAERDMPPGAGEGLPAPAAGLSEYLLCQLRATVRA